jgi:hypothetical protein
METFKIKISPEVLRNELTTQTYSGNTFGYYSGLSYVLSSGTVNLGTWNVGPPETAGNLISFGFEPIEGETPIIWICKTGSTGYNWSSYLINVNTGSTVTFTNENGEKVNYLVRQPVTDAPNFLYLFLQLTGNTLTMPVGSQINLSITQPNTSQLIDLSIPILLKQDYEDIGYYSPFDGYISQLFEDVNFTFTASTETPFDVLIYNTSKSGTTYLQNATYIIDWGDSTPIENVEVYIPESVPHSYVDVGINTGYTISLTGYTTIGSYVIRKNIKIPFVDIPNTNPYGTISFVSNNNSWSATPSSQNFIGIMDSENTIEAQSSWNFVDVPYIVSGFTQSRLEELKVYGINPYVNDLVINLPDGTTGIVNSQSPEYTAYTINDQSYIDFSAGTSVFLAQSYGLWEVNLTATTITKLEYLMNVIEQPIIQSNVFIERGKISGMENFRRIGEVNNTGSLRTYGYKFFDVRNYNDI